MKNFVLLLFVMALTMEAQSQQDPHYSHFKFNPQAFDPSTIALKKNVFCVNAVSHRQWLGYNDVTGIERDPQQASNGTVVKNVAPTTHSLNLYGPLNIRALSGQQLYIGAHFLSDRINAFSSNSIHLTLGGRFQIASKKFLLVGAQVGMQEIALDKPNFIARQIPDPRIPMGASYINDKNVDLNFGINLLM